MTKKGNKEIIELDTERATLFEVAYEEGGRKIIEKRRKRRVRLTDLIKVINEKQYIDEIPILPSGTRYHCRNGDKRVIVIEFPPQVRTVRWKTFLNRHTRQKKFTLAFPYILLCVYFYKNIHEYSQCFYRNEPLKSLDDMVCRTNLENVSPSNGIICLGEEVASFKSVDRMIRSLWDREFNSGIPDSDFYYSREIDKRIESPEVWERATQKNPLFILDIPWIKENTLRNILKDEGIITSRRQRSRGYNSTTEMIGDYMYRLKEV
ncbi:MAG: hypothetical protein HYW78_01150 [Parcubacteria group bacterium]|nr:hypothetical protein [Parcubacteria group bacterium]